MKDNRYIRECDDGWKLVDTTNGQTCIKFVQQRHQWEVAVDLCDDFGGDVVVIHEYVISYDSQIGTNIVFHLFGLLFNLYNVYILTQL